MFCLCSDAQLSSTDGRYCRCPTSMKQGSKQASKQRQRQRQQQMALCFSLLSPPRFASYVSSLFTSRPWCHPAFHLGISTFSPFLLPHHHHRQHRHQHRSFYVRSFLIPQTTPQETPAFSLVVYASIRLWLTHRQCNRSRTPIDSNCSPGLSDVPGSITSRGSLPQLFHCPHPPAFTSDRQHDTHGGAQHILLNAESHTLSYHPRPGRILLKLTPFQHDQASCYGRLRPRPTTTG